MFVRRRLVRRTTYYQVVESVVIGGKTHQRLIVSLGREPNPTKALIEMETALDWARFPLVTIPPETPKEQVARIKRIHRIRGSIAKLTEVLEKRLLPGFRMPRRRAGKLARSG
jgi:hypothetical protein